jgi:tetratricopeptide (TPR) repeat protein/two-component sensor histidine kinase
MYLLIMKDWKQNIRFWAGRLGGMAVGMVLTVSAVAQGQSKIDSLKQVAAAGKPDTNTVNAMKKLGFFLQHDDLPAATRYAEQALALAKELDFKRGVASSYQTLGQCYMYAAQTEKALENFQQGAIIAQQEGYPTVVFAALANAGIAYDLTGDYVNSVKVQLMARKWAETHGTEAQRIDIEFNLGITYCRLGNYDAALERFKDASAYYESQGDLRSHASALDAMGNIYVNLQQYDTAQAIYERAFAISSQSPAGGNLAHRYTNLGAVRAFQRDYQGAISYMEKAVTEAQKTGEIMLVADNYSNIGNCYRQLGQLELAESYSLRGLDMSRATGNSRTIMEALGNLVEVYVKKDDADKALDYYRELEALKDSLQVDEAAAEVANLRVQYEADKNAQQLLLMDEQREAAIAVAGKQKLWLVVAFSLAFALLMALVVVVMLLRNRKRNAEHMMAQKNSEFARKKMELEQRALRSQMNPHFIFNSLNAIQRLYIEGDVDRASDYMADFAQILRKILDHSSCDTITLAEELQTLKLYLRLEEARLGGVLEYEIMVDEEIDSYATCLPPLILQPYVENAIWHGILPKGSNGKVSIHLRDSTDAQGQPAVLCTITDNGIGIETSRRSKSGRLAQESKGMKISQERLGPDGMVATQELASGGTVVTLLIPVEHKRVDLVANTKWKM